MSEPTSLLPWARKRAQRGRSEAAVQKDICDNLTRLGFRVWRVGQHDARRTQDPGVPDLIAMHARYGVCFIECKREKGGRVSLPQQEFLGTLDACRAAGVTGTVLHSVEELGAWLTQRAKRGAA